MTARKSLNRYFIIFGEEDKGFGIAIDKQPTGYAKIESRNGRSKISVYVQNLTRDKGPYFFYMLSATTGMPLCTKLGELRLDDTGRGETFFEYEERNIAGSNAELEKFNVAAVLAGDEGTLAPLVGYHGKEKVLWKQSFARSAPAIKVSEEMQPEQARQAAQKTKEYEEAARSTGQADAAPKQAEDTRSHEEIIIEEDMSRPATSENLETLQTEEEKIKAESF